ncbi:MAG: hypothetical protein ACREBC_24980 [Pyrinomonadaceae bacterium]
MKLREFSILMTLMSLAVVTVNASPSDSDFETRRAIGEEDVVALRSNIPVVLAPPALTSTDKVFGAAYHDTLSILRSNNKCSDFFGGPAASEIFNKLISKVRKGYYPRSVGMKLSGSVTVRDNATMKEYRIFDDVSINTNGPFYKRSSNGESTIPRIGNYNPNTREVRVLMLLHELGHAVKGPDGAWLLTNDGDNPELSIINTQKIERACTDQIKGLAKADGQANP